MPAIQFSGLASGLDTDAIIGAILQVERIPNQRLEQQNRQLQSQSKILDRMTGALSDLASKAKALESSQAFLSFRATSSNEEVAKLAASGGASRGSYELKVQELASSQRNYSKAYADPNDAVFSSGGSKELTINIGGKDTTVTLESGESLNDLVGKINRSGADVSAGIFKGSDGYRLQVVGNKTGADNAVTYGGDLVTDLEVNDNVASEAKDARATLDGFEITSSTNTFGEVMPGVSLEVSKVQDENDPPVRLDVSPNQDDVKAKVKALVDSYNGVMNLVKEQTGKGKGANTLNGDSTVRMIESRLRETLSNVSSKLTGSDGESINLSALFKTNSKVGTISLNSSNFDKALSEDFEGMARHFAGHVDPDDPTKRVQGLSGRISQMVQELTGIGSISVDAATPGDDEASEDSSSASADATARKESIIGARKEGISRRIRGNEDRIASRERYLASYEKQLRMQYAALEEMMSSLKSQGNYLGQIR